MKRKVLTQILLSILAILLITNATPFYALDEVSTVDEDINNFEYYMIDAQHYGISKYNGNGTIIKIPETVMIDNASVTITEIGNNVFKDNTTLQQVILPDTIKKIGSYAFSNCTSLKEVPTSPSLAIISSYAFSNCTSLKEVPTSPSLAIISSYAFTGCTLFQEITIPDTVKEIDEYAFNSCTNLEKVNLSRNWKTNIGNYSPFANCSKITNINLPEGMSTIPNNAFRYMYNLNTVTIPNGVIEIGANAFYGCENLYEVELPDSLTKLGESTFGYCTRLKEIILPEGVKTLGSSCFCYCTSLEKIDMSKASNVYIPYNIMYGTTNLSVVSMPKNWRVYEGTYNYHLFDSATVRQVLIPEGTTNIYHDTFNKCKSVRRIILPESLQSLSNNAFSNASHLEWIYIPENVINISPSAFTNCDVLTICGKEGSYAQTYASTHNIPFSTEDIIGTDTNISGKVINESEIGLNEVKVSLYDKTIKENIIDEIYTDDNGCWSFAKAKIGHVYEINYNNPFYKIDNTTITISENDNILKPITAQTIVAEIETLSSDFEYSINGKYCKINKYTGNDKIVVIPSSINGCVVNEIGDNAFAYNKIIEKVILSKNIIKVGKRCFSGCSNLQYVGINSKLSYISQYMFANCTSLKDIFIPSGVISIDTYAFEYCKNLENIQLPNTLISINNHAFSSCKALKNIVIPDIVRKIDAAFLSCDNLESVSLPQYWEYAYGTFSSCSKLTNIVIPEGTVSIPDNAFSNCKQLERISLPESLKVIGDSAFSSCTKLMSNEDNFYLPSNLNKIGKNAFSGCNGLTNIVIPDSVVTISGGAFSNCTNLENITLSKNWNTINPDSTPNNNLSPFIGCNKLTTITIPEGMTIIPSYAFYNCLQLNNINISNTVTSIGMYAFSGCNRLSSLPIITNVKNIDKYAFYGCQSITSIELPDGIEKISSYAFNSCSELTTVILPDSVTDLAGYAFGNCTKLSNVKLSKNWNSLYDYTSISPFVGCSLLNDIEIPSGMVELPDYAFSGFTTLEIVKLPTGFTSIKDNVFKGCKNLEQLLIPSSVTSIGTNKNIFTDSPNLTICGENDSYAQTYANKYSIPFSIGDAAFQTAILKGKVVDQDNKGIANIQVLLYDIKKDKYINQNITTDENGEWYYSKALIGSTYDISFHNTRYKINGISNVLIPNEGYITENVVGEMMVSVESTPKSDFEYVATDAMHCKITKYKGSGFEVVVPDKIGDYLVSEIADKAFYNSTVKEKIQRIALPETITKIGKSSFDGCINLDYIGFDNNITLIDENAFNSCTSLTSIDIPDSVTTIAKLAFNNCKNLKTVKLSKNWNSTGTSSPFKGCDKLIEITIPAGMSTIPNYAFAQCSQLKMINFNDTLHTIGDYSFSGCSALTKVVIPDSVSTIGSGAFSSCTGINELYVSKNWSSGGIVFSGCTGLTSITLPQGMKSLPNSAFYGCSNLTNVVLNEDLTTINSFAFAYCTSLTNIHIPDSVTNISGQAFYDCTNLREVNIPLSWSSVNNYSSSPFVYCPSLVNITLPEGLTTLPSYAFAGCSQLEKIKFNDGLKTIGSQAFANCIKLTDINMPNTVTSINNAAFIGCTNLRNINLSSGLDTLNMNTFSNCTSLENIVLPDSLAKISEYTFSNCTLLKKIDIPDNVSTLSEYAFNNCTSLCDVKLPAKWSSRSSKSPFTGCTALASIVIPEGMISLPDYAFAQCNKIKSIDFGNTLQNIGGYAFEGCTSLRYLNFKNNVHVIDYYAFKGCTGLRYLNFENNVHVINYNAFEGCTGLETINFNDQITSISRNAFKDCLYLKTVLIPKTVTYLGPDVFINCPEVTIYIYSGTAAHQSLVNTSYNFEIIDDHEHEYERTIKKEPTCTENGEAKYICSICNFYYIEKIDALGHEYVDKVVEPTCTTVGYTEHTCSRGDSSYRDNEVSALGHDYVKTIVHPSCGNEGYDLYKCTRCNDSYKENIINALVHEYVETIVKPTCTTDGYTLHTCNNCNTSYKDNYIKATGHSYEVTVIAPTCTEQGYTLKKCNNCGNEEKDNYVAALGHDYEDWVIDKEPTVVGVGHKHRTCKRCNAIESVDIPRIEIQIDNNTDYGVANIKIVNAQTLDPIKNAQVYISTQNDGESTFYTDEKGCVSMVLPVGQQTISAYANGTLVRTISVNIKPGVNDIPQIGLSNKPVYETTFTSHQMTEQEIKDAGIDIASTNNQHVYKYNVNIKHEADADPYSFYYFMCNGIILSGGSINSSGGDGMGTGTGAGSGGGSSSGVAPGWITGGEGTDADGYFFIPGIKGEPSTSIYPVSENCYLIIRGEVRWLKEIFDVEMLITNNSNSDTLEDLKASIELPDGLSLAEMTGNEQTLEQSIDKIDHEKSESVHWYVRGDKPGKYGVSGKLTGTIQPHGQVINDTYQLSEKLQVWAGNALQLDFKFPRAAYSNSDYSMTVTLTNISDITLYNMSHIIQVEQGMEYLYNDGSTESKIETSEWLNNQIIKEFKPGEKIIIKTTVNTFFKSKIFDRELEMMKGNIDEIEKMQNCWTAIQSVSDATNALVDNVSSCNNALASVTLEGTSKKEQLFNNLKENIMLFMKSYGSDGNKVIDAAIRLSSTGVNDTLKEITSNPMDWLDKHDERELVDLITKISALEKNIGSSTGTKFDIFDSIRTAISLIPMRFAFKDIVMSDSESSSTNIKWNYTVSDDSEQYYGISNQSKYLTSIAQAVMGEIYKDDESTYNKLIPAIDNPNVYEDAVKYIQATEKEAEIFKAKDTTGKVTYTAWVESNLLPQRNYMLMSRNTENDFNISCDNETTTIQDGKITFTGEGNISVTPNNTTNGILHIEDNKGHKYMYELGVVAQHECSASQQEVIIPPTSSNDGIAVKRCDTCGEILDVITLKDKECTHVFGEWQTQTDPTCSSKGVQERTCSICGDVETTYIDMLPHTVENWTITRQATCSKEGEKEGNCTVCHEKIIESITKTPHTEGEWVIVKDSTAFEKGLEELHCSICNEVMNKKEILEKNYTFGLGDEGNTNKIITGFSEQVTSEMLKEHFDRIEKKDTEITINENASYVGTGSKIKYNDVEYTVIVEGDTTGDGLINVNDLRSLCSHVLTNNKLINEYKKAGLIVNDEEINVFDIVAVKRKIEENETNGQSK